MTDFIHRVSVFSLSSAPAGESRMRFITSDDDTSGLVLWASTADLEKLPKSVRSVRMRAQTLEKVEFWAASHTCVALEVEDARGGIKVRGLQREARGAGAWEVTSSGGFEVVDIPTRKHHKIALGSRLIVASDEKSHAHLEQFLALVNGFQPALGSEVIKALCRPDLESRLLHHELRLAALEAGHGAADPVVGPSFATDMLNQLRALITARRLNMLGGITLAGLAALGLGAGAWMLYEHQTQDPPVVVSDDKADPPDKATEQVYTQLRQLETEVENLVDALAQTAIDSPKPDLVVRTESFSTLWNKRPKHENSEKCLAAGVAITNSTPNAHYPGFMNCLLPASESASEEAEAEPDPRKTATPGKNGEVAKPDGGSAADPIDVKLAARCFVLAMCDHGAKTDARPCTFSEKEPWRATLDDTKPRSATTSAGLDSLSCSLSQVMGMPPSDCSATVPFTPQAKKQLDELAKRLAPPKEANGE